MVRKTDLPRGALAALAKLSTANLADAVMRLRLPLRLAPPGLEPVIPGKRIFGPARPVRHFGSVDIFLEALGDSRPGDVAVIDNGGRRDEGAIGDLIAREFQNAGIAGIILWGAHRDTVEIRGIGFPVFSLGAFPAGPRSARRRGASALKRARIGDEWVTDSDIAVADDDGAIFFPAARLKDIAAAAAAIRDREAEQADRQTQGTPLRVQLNFTNYLVRRKKNPRLTFRTYLRETKGAIEV